MSEEETTGEVLRQRQWVALRGGSLDVRGGKGICGRFARDLRTAIGKPHDCALLSEAGVPQELVDAVHRDFSDQGYVVHAHQMPEGACDLAQVERLDRVLAESGITADDAVVVLGGVETLSVASFACSSWCGGVSLVEVPLDAPSAIVAAPTPRALDLAGLPRVVSQEGSARFSIVDVGAFDVDPASEPMRHAFALMVAAAMCDGNKAFEHLWDAADDLVAGNEQVIMRAILDSVKSRGRVAASTAASTRQSIVYGTELARALAAVAGPAVPPSVLLADGMRFAARLAVATDALSVDDMFTQDELLERLGVGTTEVPVDPEELTRALRAERFRRSRRFMLALPRSLGRVRLAIVGDDLLAEHVAAWCASR